MMLALYIIKNESLGDAFRVLDILVIMTDLLGIQATKDQVHGVIKNNTTWFKTEKDPENGSGVRYRLLNAGFSYGKSLAMNTNL